MKPVERGQLEAVARKRPSSPRRAGRQHDGGRDRSGGFDLHEWIRANDVLVVREGPWGHGGYRHVLAECPRGHTDNSAYVVSLPNGAIAGGCHHDSCSDLEWTEIRGHYEPDAYDRVPVRDADPTKATPATKPAPWPVLAEEAFYGLAGRIAQAIMPHTEADPVAIIVDQLITYGNVIGRGARHTISADVHHAKLFGVLVGATSGGRKGTSSRYSKLLMHPVDSTWAEDLIQHGISTGEGLIEAVRDPVLRTNKEGESVVVDPGIRDKRLKVVEPEFGKVLAVMLREGNTLSSVVRLCWDDERLQIMTRAAPVKATGTHISVMGHVTRDELLKLLGQTEAVNGFANRFLWLMVRRSQELAYGGRWPEVDTAPLVNNLREAVEFGWHAGEITWGESARSTWEEVYGPLSAEKPGLFGAVTARAEAQVVRIAMIYALMDLSATIEYEHLLAALAIWEYAEASARYIWGDATGNSVADRIGDALKGAREEGLTRTELSELFRRHQSAQRITQALNLLAELGRVRRVVETTDGRPIERWFAT